MIFQLTTYGFNLLNANTGPVTIDTYKLGSAVNYVASVDDIDIRGTTLFTGAVSSYTIVNANVVKYGIYLDYNTGDFQFGEVGLYVGSQLFALGVSTNLISKIRSASAIGNSIKLDTYLSVVGQTYTMWFDLWESTGQQLTNLSSPDLLPPSHQATPNVYIIQGADSRQSSMLAYTDQQGLWTFDAYQFASIAAATVVAADNISVTISVTDFDTRMEPAYFGQVILEFTTGTLYSICRYIKTFTPSGSTITLGFNTQLAVVPVVGDKFQTFQRMTSSTTELVLPIASPEILGAIKVGNSLSITQSGVLNVDTHQLGLVTSVNARTGDVLVNAQNLPGLATVGITNDYNDLLNTPSAYSLPTMSTTIKGGARLPANGNLITSGEILDLGFSPVKTVSHISPDSSGNVDISGLTVGLVNPTPVAASANLNTYFVAGLFYVTPAVALTVVNAPTTGSATLEVVPLSAGSGDCVQRYSTDTDLYWRKLTGAAWTSWKHVLTSQTSDSTKLDKVNGIAQGLFLSTLNLGNITTSVTFNMSSATVQIATFTGGSVTWTLSGWPPAGTYSENQLKLIHGGLSTHTFPSSVWFINPDGSWTKNFATYLSNQRGPTVTNLQPAGTDFMVLMSDDGGVTVTARVF